MFADLQGPTANIAKRSPHREATGPSSFERASFIATTDSPLRSDGNGDDSVVLWRGPKMMVLFRGCPAPLVVRSLRQAGVMIGLVLSASELPKVRGLDDYSYVFVSAHRHARPTLADGVADLEGNNWTLDDSAA